MIKIGSNVQINAPGFEGLIGVVTGIIGKIAIVEVSDGGKYKIEMRDLREYRIVKGNREVVLTVEKMVDLIDHVTSVNFLMRYFHGFSDVDPDDDQICSMACDLAKYAVVIGNLMAGVLFPDSGDDEE